MKEFKGTPGPWIESIVSYAAYTSLHIQTVDTSHSNTFIGEIGGGLQTDAEIKANAKLIAAAPELLGALQDMCHLFQNSTIEQQEAKSRSMQAIDKALGS